MRTLSNKLLADLAEACGLDPTVTCSFIYGLTGNESLSQVGDALFRPVKVLLIFLAAVFFVRFLRRVIDRSVTKIIAGQAKATLEAEQAAASGGDEVAQARSRQVLNLRRAQRAAFLVERGRQRAETIGAVLRSIATVIVYTLATLIALGEFDINLGPLIASAGIVGVALGFGAQSLVKDFLSGIFMVLEDQYGVGDVVDVGEASGVVEGVSLRTTRVRDVNGTLWFVPNGEIRRVGNKSQQWARAVIDIEVAYDTDLAKAMTVIKRVADEVWHERLEVATIIEEPEIWGVESFGENSIVIRLAVKTEAAEHWSTARIIRHRLKEAFDLEGIEIPFPQRTVWMHHLGGEVPPPLPLDPS
ncbi:MAG TPA: mechanosensitive ion channel family protein [Acidimicrobiia bacterium]|nr:mechanosensitive ion channel family protein [Acidimicrobiia bacterium]